MKKLRNLKTEFSRVTWPGKEKVARETVAVCISTILLGAIIKLVDMVMQTGISFLVK